MKKNKNSGYVALIGRTNAGKSTFLNSILETKVSIVSDKPQTTRRQILGIHTTPKGQVVFFDSPGIHKPEYRLNQKMMKDVHNSLMDADLILYFVDIKDRDEDNFIISLLDDKKNVFLVINKIDKLAKEKALVKMNRMKDMYPWKEIVPISALKKTNIDLLEDLIFSYLPESDIQFYDEEESTVQSEKFYISELIREKLLNQTRDELPYSTFVKADEIKDRGNIIYVRATIHVEKPSQRKIVIGKKGLMIKKIGEDARVEIEEYFDKKVFLDLFVKVVPNWRNSQFILQDIFE
ncbi:MAG: GTPase Era [Candidatus Aminicenantes bacterium]|nr:GTPase Era [Candidatus Aminicenantes bacterium]MCK5004705.1 GTPase Era [Candidatus Aminicenantes bacterium]